MGVLICVDKGFMRIPLPPQVTYLLNSIELKAFQSFAQADEILEILSHLCSESNVKERGNRCCLLEQHFK